MIVRRDQIIVAFLCAQNFQSPVGDHFIGVHVHRSTGAALNAVHHELILPLSFADLFRRLNNGCADLRRHPTGPQIGPGSGGFDDSQRNNEIPVQFIAGNIKIMHGPRCLNSIIQPIRNLNLAQKVLFSSHAVLLPPSSNLFFRISKIIRWFCGRQKLFSGDPRLGHLARRQNHIQLFGG